MKSALKTQVTTQILKLKYTMKAIVLVKDGRPDTAFEIQELPKPKAGKGEIVVKVSHFGLNYADIMARKGLYNDRPPLPCVLGYEVVGTVEEVGESVLGFAIGDYVVAFTQFGGYAEYAKTDARGAVRLSPGTDPSVATALATQYCTAWFAACHMVNLKAGDHVLVHAAAGGVGTALVQIAKSNGCIVFGTASSAQKLNYLKAQGVDYPINYKEKDFEKEINALLGAKKRLDVVFDPIGGKNFKRSMGLLGSGGRIVPFGASDWSASKGGFMDKLKLVFGFGFLHPIGLMMKSKGVIGVNMLRIGENKAEYLNQCLEEVYAHFQSNTLKPTVDSVWDVADLYKAHQKLEGRATIGKVVVKW